MVTEEIRNDSLSYWAMISRYTIGRAGKQDNGCIVQTHGRASSASTIDATDVRLGAIKEESIHDEELRKIRAALLKDESSHPGYSVEGERLLY